MAGCSEDDNETSGSIEGGEFFHYQNNCYLLDKKGHFSMDLADHSKMGRRGNKWLTVIVITLRFQNV